MDTFLVSTINLQIQRMIQRGFYDQARQFFANMVAKGVPAEQIVWSGPADQDPHASLLSTGASTFFTSDAQAQQYGFATAGEANANWAVSSLSARQPAPVPAPAPSSPPPTPIAPGFPTPVTAPTPTATPPAPAGNALSVIRGLFPWLDQIGIDAEQVRGWVVQFGTLNPEAILAEVRKTSAYQHRFPGLTRADGSMRMDEATYFAREDDYRKLLRQYGRPDYEYNDPADYQAFFQQEVDPNELKQRFDTFLSVRRGSDDVRGAFYVYAGMRLTDEQLYNAAVNPTERKKLLDEYNQRTAAAPLDYATWITRATEAGLDRVTRTLQDLADQGVVTGGAIGAVTALDSDFARTMMDQLYHGGGAIPGVKPLRRVGPPIINGAAPPGGQQYLSLTELLHAFDYALIGGAASSVGLALPDADRVAALRQAGVDRARALEGYSQIANRGNEFQGALGRLNRNVQFSTKDFEQAIFLNSGSQASLLSQALGQEKALGEAVGGPAVSIDRTTGQLQQRGLRAA